MNLKLIKFFVAHRNNSSGGAQIGGADHVQWCWAGSHNLEQQSGIV